MFLSKLMYAWKYVFYSIPECMRYINHTVAVMACKLGTKKSSIFHSGNDFRENNKVKPESKRNAAANERPRTKNYIIIKRKKKEIERIESGREKERE